MCRAGRRPPTGGILLVLKFAAVMLVTDVRIRLGGDYRNTTSPARIGSPTLLLDSGRIMDM